MVKKLFFIILGTVLVGSSFYYFYPTPPPLSPLPDAPVLASADSSSSPKQIIGFLPFWTLKFARYFDYSALTQIAYFALKVDQQGNIVKKEGRGEAEPGWYRLHSEDFSFVRRQAKQHRVKLLLVIKAEDNQTMTALIEDPVAQANLADQLISLLEEKQLNGVNLDFEFANQSPLPSGEDFTRFVQNLSSQLKTTHPDYLFSLDVFADTVRKRKVYQIERLASSLDQLIVMGYDFHLPSSDFAGPIAPLIDQQNRYSYTLTAALADFLQLVPRQKLVLGVPYYGYQWQTQTDQPHSRVLPRTGKKITFAEVVKAVQQDRFQLQWDPHSQTPYAIWQEDGVFKQAYFETSRSLGLKYDLVNQLDIAGIAIWALGFDEDRPELWQLLKQKFPSLAKL